MKDFHYTYLCAPSAETRGYRPTHNNGCGRMCVYSTSKEIAGRNRPQASPCKICGNRKRLNEGTVTLWFDRRDANHHASEYNEVHFDSAHYSDDEQSAEQVYEQEVSNQ